MGGAGDVKGPAAAAPQGGAPSRTLELRKGEAAPHARQKLEELGRGFESLFAQTVLSELLEPLQGAGLAGSGPGASVVRGLLETHLSDHVAKAGGFGIGRMVVRTLEPMLAARKVSVEELAEAGRRTREPGPAPAFLDRMDPVGSDGKAGEEGR